MSTSTSDVVNGSTPSSRKKDVVVQDRMQQPSSQVESDANHTMHNGHSTARVPSASINTRLSTPIITPSGYHIERESFVRMLTQTLSSLGYQAAAAQLEQESGVEFESQLSTQFRRAICLGEWDNARSMCNQLKFDPPNKKNEFIRLFAEQKYVHMIEQVIRMRQESQSPLSESNHKDETVNGSSSNGTHTANSTAANGTAATSSATDALVLAVQFLQTELVPLLNSSDCSTISSTAASPAPTTHMLHLASLFTCTSLDALRSVYQGDCIIANNNNSKVTADQSSVYYPLFQRCIPYLSHSSLVMNDNQLLSLLDQSIRSQVDQCPFHHERAPHTFDLNHRHQCALTLPDKPLITLSQHSDEILHLAFSHSTISGKPASILRLATCSKDGTIQVYNIKFKHHHAHHRRRSSQSTSSRPQLEEEKQSNGSDAATHINNGKYENGSAKVLNGFTHHPAASLAAATAAAASSTLSSLHSSSSHFRSSSAEFEVNTQWILRPPASSSRAGTPSPSASSRSASPLNSSTAVYTVSWSPDNEYLLAYNGEEASVFHVEDGVCVLTVGAKAVDTLAAAAIEAVNAAASTAAATTSTSVPATATGSSQVDASSSRSGSFSLQPSVSPLPSQQHSLALQHVSRLLSSPLLQSISQFHASINDFNARRSAAGNESQSGNSSSASSEHENIMGHAEPITACAWCADSCTFVTGSADRRLILWDLTGEIIDVWTGDMIQDITIVGNRMIVSTPQSKIIVFQIRNRKLEECESMQESTYVTSVGLSTDSRYALINLMRPAEIHMWNLGPAPDQFIPSASANFVWPQSVTDSRMDASSSAVSSSSSSAAISAAAAASASRTPIGSVHPSALPLISPEPTSHASSLVHRYSGFFASRYVIRSCFAGPSEHLVISGSEDGLVYIWHRESQKLLKALRGHTSTVNSIVACEFQGRYLFASASDDHTAKIWRIDSQHTHGQRTEASAHSANTHAHNGHHHTC